MEPLRGKPSGMEEVGLRHLYKYHGGGLGPSKGLGGKHVLNSLARSGRFWGACQSGSGWTRWGVHLLSSYFNPSSCLIRGSTWNSQATGHATQTPGSGWLWVEDCPLRPLQDPGSVHLCRRCWHRCDPDLPRRVRGDLGQLSSSPMDVNPRLRAAQASIVTDPMS